MSPDVVGSTPSDEENFWFDVAIKDTPDQSLTRLDTYGKSLFGSVATIGTLLTGFGVLKPEAAAALKNPWLLLPVGLACLSLAFAVMGTVPRTGEINRSDIDSIRLYYNNLIRERGKYIFLAGATFACGLFSVAVVLLLGPRFSDPSPITSFRIERSEKSVKLVGRFEMEGLVPSSIGQITIKGFTGRSAESAQPLLVAASRPNASGRLVLDTSLDRVALYKRFLVGVEVRARDRLLYHDELDLRW